MCAFCFKYSYREEKQIILDSIQSDSGMDSFLILLFSQRTIEPVFHGQPKLSLYLKQYGLKSDCSLGSSLSRACFVCYHETIWSQGHKALVQPQTQNKAQ